MSLRNAFIARIQMQVVLSCLLFVAQFFFDIGLASAQRGGPGGGRDSSSMRGILGRDTFQAELNITEDQKKLIEELREKYQVDRDAMGPIFDKMRNAQSDEERSAAQSEMRKLTDASALEFEKAAEKVLDVKQLTRAREIYLQQAGPRALMRTDYAEKYQLTSEQKQKLEQLTNEMEAARMQMGFRVSDEDREKFNKEWNVKMLEVLNSEQKTSLEKSQGAPVVSATSGTAGSTPGTPMPAVTVAPQREVVELPRDPNKKEFASFDVDAKSATLARNDASSPVNNSTTTMESKNPSEGIPPTPTEKLVSFNFSFAPWMDVLKQYADRNNLTLNLMDTPQGTFNYYDRKQYTPAQALDVMNGYLLTRGYCLIRKDEFLICLNIDNGIPPNLIPTVTLEDLSKHGKNEIVAVVFPIGTLDVNVLAAEVSLLIGPQGKVIPLKGAASVMVQDISQNLQRISGLVQQMTANANPEAISFRVFKLANIRAQQAESILKGLSGQSTGITNVSAASERSRYDRDRERERSPQPPQQSTQAASLNGVTMTVEPRTNSLLITATAAQFLLIEATLKAIDVPDSEISPIAQLDDTTPELRVYQVYDADAREVTKTLDVIMPGIVVNEDGEKGKIHIFTTPFKHKIVDLEIKKLDGLVGSSNATVIPLSTLDPLSTTVTLRSMFIADGVKAPVIEADAFGRRIIIRGSDSQIAEIRSILNQLGETGETGSAVGSLSSGPVRSISLGGRDPEQLLPLVEQLWGKSSGSKIRVVKPSERGNGLLNTPLKSPEVPPAKKDEGVPPATTSLHEGRDDIEEQHLGQQGRLFQVSLVEESNIKESGTDLTITVINGELILTGGTEDDRDKLEELIRSLAQTIPVQNSWTVYYLRAADATATAEMLEQLIPSSVVATTSSSSTSMLGSMTSGLSSMSDSLLDLSGLSSLGGSTSLTIVPEIRLNALFVSGPAHLVRDVEAMLEVLDAAERPESLRERQPRLIPVEHADVNEVYKIVNDVYKDILQPNPLAALARGGGGGGGNNPLAMLMGQGGKAGGSAAPETKLTLGVDERTSNLIVSADDAMFREIEGLVQNIDKAAQDAKRTIRIVNLQHADPTLIKNTLGTLVPRVKISTSGSPRVSSNSPPALSQPGSSSSGGSGGDAGNQDAFRQIMEQRFREAVEQRGGGGGGGGGNIPGQQPGSGGRSFGPPGGSRAPVTGGGGGNSRGGGNSGRGR